jgi:hypothetical protein
VESDKGISRAEIFQMLQDHFYAAPHEKTDPRHFEKIYTWLKKNFPIFDLTKIGYLGWSITYDLITAFPLALMHFKLQQAVLVNKIAENNVRYKAAKEASKFK